MKYANIPNQTVVIKGSNHPDSLADRFADVAITEIEKFNSGLHANIDKSYLKAGRFPEFIVQGYLSFDFRVYDKEYRYNLFNSIKKGIVEEFKAIFPEPVIKVDFNLNFEPSYKEKLLTKNKFTDTSFIAGIVGFTEVENDLMLLTSFIEDLEYVESDFKLTLLNNREIIIEQTFIEPDNVVAQRYIDDVSDYIKTLDSLKENYLIFNPEWEDVGIRYARYGTSLFYNRSGKVGNSNQWYGFTSPQRMWGSTPYGKGSHHPSKYLVNQAKNIIPFDDKTENYEYLLHANASDSLDDYKMIKYPVK